MRLLPGIESRLTAKPPPALVSRETAFAEQRLRILRAAGELAAEHGCRRLTIEAIAKRAHVSYGTFYKHFTDKEDCLVTLFDEVIAATEGTIRDRLSAEQLPWPEQVRFVLSSLVEQIVAEPVIARAVLVEAPSVAPGALESYERACTSLVRLFAEGRAFGERGAPLPYSVEDTLAGSLFWSLQQRLIAGDLDGLPLVIPEMAELILRTYLGPTEAARLAPTRLPPQHPAARAEPKPPAHGPPAESGEASLARSRPQSS